MASQSHIVMKMATEPAKAESVPAYASRKLRARVPAKVQGRRKRSGSRVHRFVAERDFKGASGPMLPVSLGAQMKPRPVSLRLPSNMFTTAVLSEGTARSKIGPYSQEGAPPRSRSALANGAASYADSR